MELGKIVVSEEIFCEGWRILLKEHNGIVPQTVEDYPYAIVEKLTDKIYPELYGRTDLIYTCIEVCFYNAFKAGLSFYDLLKYLHKSGFH